MSSLKNQPGVFRLNDAVLPYGEVMDSGVITLEGKRSQFENFTRLAIRFAALAADKSYKAFEDEKESTEQRRQAFQQVELAAKLTAGLPKETQDEILSGVVASVRKEDRDSVSGVVGGVRELMTRKYSGIVARVLPEGREAAL